MQLRLLLLMYVKDHLINNQGALARNVLVLWNMINLWRQLEKDLFLNQTDSKVRNSCSRVCLVIKTVVTFRFLFALFLVIIACKLYLIFTYPPPLYRVFLFCFTVITYIVNGNIVQNFVQGLCAVLSYVRACFNASKKTLRQCPVLISNGYLTSF